MRGGSSVSSTNRARHARVLLIAVEAKDLGFGMESIRDRLPDCIAKRRFDPRQEGWRRVRIEFEHLSSNFNNHGNDAKGCDLAVCWKHDWKECPHMIS